MGTAIPAVSANHTERENSLKQARGIKSMYNSLKFYIVMLLGMSSLVVANAPEYCVSNFVIKDKPASCPLLGKIPGESRYPFATVNWDCVGVKCALPKCFVKNQIASVSTNTATGGVDKTETVYFAIDQGGIMAIVPGNEAQIDANKHYAGTVSITVYPVEDGEVYGLYPDCSGKFNRGRYKIKVKANWNFTMATTFTAHAGFQVSLFRGGATISNTITASASGTIGEENPIVLPGGDPVIDFTDLDAKGVNDAFAAAAQPYIDHIKAAIQDKLDTDFEDLASNVTITATAINTMNTLSAQLNSALDYIRFPREIIICGFGKSYILPIR